MTDYQIAVIADEQDMQYDISFSGKIHKAGEPIKPYLTFEVNGKPWKAENMKVLAKIKKPEFSIGKLLSETTIPSNVPFKFEEGSLNGENKWTYLTTNEEIVQKIWQEPETVLLTPDEKGVFHGIYEKTKVAGNYNLTFEIEELSDKPDQIIRTESRSINVGFGTIDLKTSEIKVKKLNRKTFQFSIRPMDEFGNLLGPDHLRFFTPTLHRGEVLQQKDNGDGSYLFEIRTKSRRESFTLAYKNEIWLRRKLK